MFAKQTKWIFKAPKIWDKDDTDKKLVFFLTALTMVLRRFATIDEKKVNEKLNKELHKQENKWLTERTK